MDQPDGPLASVHDIEEARRRRRATLVMQARAEISITCRHLGLQPDRVARHFCADAGVDGQCLADLADGDVLALLAVVRDRKRRQLEELMQPRYGR